MLIASIPVTDYQKTKQQISQVLSQADGIECRFDYMPSLNLDSIAALRHEFSAPMIFTLRKKSHGGFYSHDETYRLQAILLLCQLRPEYIDLEYDVPRDFIQQIHKRYPDIKLICSYHNFDETPFDLVKLLQSMQHPSFYAYKIATKARSTLDALHMLKFVSENQHQYKLTGICMGEYGSSTRILGPIVGNQFIYASVDDAKATAPGQLTIAELNTIYSGRQLSKQSKIYALLGDPVNNSVGHLLHNQAIKILKQDAVYVKLAIKPEELPQALSVCRTLPFAGFSVTRPLKETIMFHLDEVDYAVNKIKAVNTIVIGNKKLHGFNTDGIGAMQALSHKINLENKNIIILGAGGSAKAIAHAVLESGAHITLFNRTLDTVRNLASELKGHYYTLDHIAELKNMNYDILINTLPLSDLEMQKLINSENLIPHTFAMDIVYQPIHTTFLKIAQQAGCHCVPGYEMYIQQALMQIKYWFQPTINEMKEIENSMSRYFFEVQSVIPSVF